MYTTIRAELDATLAEIRAAGLYKTERQLASPQSAHVRSGGRDVLNFCANNYLGLADDPRLVAAAKASLDEWGFGMASVRFICGTQTQHVELEMVDDSHAVGFVGPSGAGTPELFGVRDRVDIIAGTLGKALGGASGGYISAHAEIVELLRQRARPYLFSNAVAPSVVAASLVALDLVAGGAEQRATLWRNARDFRERMEAAGFDLLPGEHAIIPVMFPDAHDAVAIADALLERGVYVIPFSYPVVPLGKARIRVQISAGHSADDIATCVQAFVEARDAVRAPRTPDM